MQRGGGAAAAAGGAGALVPMMGPNVAAVEYNKVAAGLRLLQSDDAERSATRCPGVFLLVTDKEAHSTAPDFMLKNPDVRIADYRSMGALHGECLAALRRFALHPSRAAVESAGAAVAEALPAVPPRVRHPAAAARSDASE